MVPRNALVVYGGGFAPGREPVLALGHGPPHAAGTREVGGGTGVVDAALVGGRDAALDAAHGAANREVLGGEVLHRRVGELLHPRLQLVGAVQLSVRVFVEQLLGALDAGAGLNLFGHLALTGDDALQLLHAPDVGFVQVDGGAQEGARVQAVRLAAHRIAGGCGGLQNRHEVVIEVAVTVLGALGTLCGGLGQLGLGGGNLGGQLVKETAGRVVRGGLLDDDVHLAARGNLAVRAGRLEAQHEPVQRLGHAVHAADNVLPVLAGVALHEVEDGAHLLRHRGDVVELPIAESRLALGAVQAQALLKGVQGDQVDIVDGQNAVNLLEGFLGQAV